MTKIKWDVIGPEIIVAYRNNVTSIELGIQYGLKPNTIRSYLRRQGVKSPRYFSFEDVETLKKFTGVKTAAEIGRILRVSSDSIKQLARRLEISLRICRPRTHHKKSFFSQIGIQQCYIAGIFAADATIYDNKNISFSLSCRDSELVKYIKNTLDYDGVTTIDKSRSPSQHNQLKFSINNAEQITNDLQKFYNITPRKSLNLAPPDESFLTKETTLAYIAGFIEGDGHVGHNVNSLSISCEIASRDFAEWLQKKFSELTSGTAWLKPRRHLGRNQIYWSVGLSGRNARYLCAQILELGVTKLERKWAIARDKIAWHQDRDDF